MNRNDPAKRYKLARWATLAVSTLMAANVLAIGLGSHFAYRYLYFTCVPGMIAGLGQDNDFGFPALPFTATALAMAAAYALYWALAKRRPGWLKAAFAGIIADSAVMLPFVIFLRATGGPLFWEYILPAAALHAAALACLGMGVKARR